MRTAILQREQFPPVAKQYDVLTEQPDGTRFALYLPRGDDRIPIILEPEFRNAEPSIGKFTGLLVVLDVGHAGIPSERKQIVAEQCVAVRRASQSAPLQGGNQTIGDFDDRF